MRIFSAFLIFIFVYSECAEAQNQAKDVTVLKIKNYHLPRANDFNSWDIGVHFGTTFPRTDISASNKRDLAYGVDVTKFFTHSFGLQARFLHATLSGIDSNNPLYGFNTTIDYDLTLNAILQIGNISFLKRAPWLAIYATFGAGVIHYSPGVYLDGGTTILNGIYSQYTLPFDTVNYKGSTDVVIPVGIGIKCRVSKAVSVNAEFSMRTTNTDRLDGFFKLLSEDDDYIYVNAGITFHIGRRQKVLEWVNPLQSVYDDIYDMKEKIDLITRDSDHDGVADLYDVEPNTPAGVKVYGDGSSIDSDGDGVPDHLDAEPFSRRNAKVDATGKEITEALPVKNEVKEEKVLPVKKASGRAAKKIIVPKTDTKSAANPANVSNIAGNNYLPPIYFAFNDDKINSKFDETLAGIAQVIINNPDYKYKLVGNYDGEVNAEYNIQLAKKRAEAVKKILIEKYNIKSERLIVEIPAKSDQLNGSNPLNRRVDFIVSE